MRTLLVTLDIKSIHYHLNSDEFLENVSVFMRYSFEKIELIFDLFFVVKNVKFSECSITCAYVHIGAQLKVKWRIEIFFVRISKIG